MKNDNATRKQRCGSDFWLSGPGQIRIFKLEKKAEPADLNIGKKSYLKQYQKNLEA